MRKNLFKKSAAIAMATLVAVTGMSLPTITTVFAEEDITAETTVNTVENVAAENATTENKETTEQTQIEASAQKTEEVKEVVSEQTNNTQTAPIEEKKEETKTEETVATQQTSNAAQNTQVVEEAPVVKTDLTVHLINILYTARKSVNGKAVPFEDTLTMVKGQGKLTTGYNSNVGGKNYKSSTAEGSVQFLNAFVLTTAGSDVVTTSEASAAGFQTIKKVNYKGSGEVVLTYTDGSTQTLTDTYDIYVAPVYQLIRNSKLNYNYIDRISTGSGSWSNQGAFSSYKHTFKDPSVATPVQHYKFLYWENTDKNIKLTAGQADSYAKTDIPQGTTKDVYTYANWQPSVTVRYYDYDGNLLVSGEIEKYEDINIYDSYEAPEMEGAEFLGWFEGTDADAEQIEETAVATLPGITVDPVERKIVNVYAHYNTSYTVKHLQQNITDDGYTEVTEDQEVITDVLAGTTTEALANEYEGFTAQDVSQATIARDGSTVIEINYDRNMYTVSYAYDEDAPENAPELPEAASYRFGADVEIAEDPALEGYTFSGWSLVEDFEMPAEDVVITGSFTEIPKVVPAAVVPNGPTAPTANPTNTPDGQPTVPPTTNTQAIVNNQVPTAQTIADNQTPQAQPTALVIEEVEDAAVPMAANSQWALLNLILSLASAAMALFMVISFVIGKRQDENEDAQKDERDERSRNGLKFLGLIPALASIILFILTENMNAQMVLTDRWTLLTAILTAITLVLMIFVKNRKDKEDSEVNNEKAFETV